MRRAFFACCVATWVVVAGCECQPAAMTRCEGAPAGVAVDEPTWHRDVRPIVEARCARCHVEDGLAPFPLATVDDVKQHADEVRRAVVTRRMPPWMPAPCCNEFQDDPSLTPDQIATFTRWLDLDGPVGTEAEQGEPLPPVGALPRVDVTLAMPDAYLPDVVDADDTRCFLLDWPFDDVKFVTGFGVTPGIRAQVHHAMVVIAPGSAIESFRSLDDADDDLGWSCPGGAVLGIDGYLGGWSPGWDGKQTPVGTGHRVDPDDVVILTVHYSRPSQAGAAVEPDQTSVDLMLADEVDDTLLSISVFDARWTVGGLPIPKDADDVRFAAEYDPTDVLSLGRPLEILAVNLHMHERGKSGMVGVKRKDGSEECLVQIDDYDHAWQGDYTFREPRFIEDGDLAYVECVFDNTRANQRIVAGAPEEPRDLNWAEDQEMCVAFITAKMPK